MATDRVGPTVSLTLVVVVTVLLIVLSFAALPAAWAVVVTALALGFAAWLARDIRCGRL